jgi:hypothetical protein
MGAVSPAGWGVPALRQALTQATPVAAEPMPRPVGGRVLAARRVPVPTSRPAFMGDPRMRRSPPIAQFVVAAAIEALGADRQSVVEGKIRLGLVIGTMCGCVSYSRRFYHEALHEPATASPLLFPETVFNAPGSHLAALLRSTGPNYTLVGDQGSLGVGLAIAADWLWDEQVDGCLVIGAEELDWVMADAMALFTRRVVLSEGAGALYLRRDETGSAGIELAAVASPRLYRRSIPRETCIRQVRAELPALMPGELLCDSQQGASSVDGAESRVWMDWSGARISPRGILGEGLAAGAAWQLVAAADALGQGVHGAATVSLVGCNEQASGVRLVRV